MEGRGSAQHHACFEMVVVADIELTSCLSDIWEQNVAKSIVN